MTRSSPARRSHLLSSPDRRFVSNFLTENRNGELSHRDALLAAQVEHERVREAAIRVYELHELQQEHRRIVEQERREEERLRAEALIVAEEKRLRELKAKTIPKPPPEPEPKPAPEPPKQTPAEKQAITNGSTPIQESKKAEPSTTPPSDVKKPQPNGLFSTQTKPAQPSPLTVPTQDKPAPANPFSAPAQTQPPPSSTPLARPNGLALFKPAAVPIAKPAQPQVPSTTARVADRYSQIHKELKKLRNDLQAQARVAGSPLKGKMGTYRREIRVSIGQLTGGRGANAQPVSSFYFKMIFANCMPGQQDQCNLEGGFGGQSSKPSD